MNATIPRVLSELLFPVLGIVFWQWGFAFILWFVAMDVITQLASGIFIKNYSWDWRKQVVQGMELILILSLITLNSENFIGSFVDFFMYSDAGVPQGYLLFPLIVLSEIMRLKMERKTGIKIHSLIGQHIARVSVLGILIFLSFAEVKEIFLSIVFLVLSGLVILSIKPKVIRI